MSSSSQSDWFALADTSELQTPSILIYPDRVESNLRAMIDQFGGVDRLRPHVKTHKMPKIVEMKRALGINKFKASTIAESEMVATAGGSDVLLAYPLIGPNIQRFCQLIKQFPSTRFAALVDEAKMLDPISKAARASGQSVELMVDLNVGMNRTGMRPGRALELCEQIDADENLVFAGLHAYDGHLHSMPDATLSVEVEEAFAPVWKLADSLRLRDVKVKNIVASGSPTSHLLSRDPGVEVSAGTTVFWDAMQPQHSLGVTFHSAAVVATRVISKPTNETLCLDLGHKAVASEFAPPRVKFLNLDDAEEIGHSEEHLVVRSPSASSRNVGDVLYGIPYHVCPTIALHQDVGCVRDAKIVERWDVTARNRRITI